VKIRLVTSLRQFDALAPLWREVAREGGHASPFLSHDWFACCWRTAGASRRREVWIVEDSAGPLALIPLLRWRTTVRGLPVRVLGFLDAPDTPFGDLVVARGRDEVLSTLLAELRARGDWDLLWLAKLPAHSPTLKALELALPGQFPWRVAGTQVSPCLAISTPWETFFRGKTQRFRKTCRNIENRIERAGKVAVETHHAVDPDGPVFADLMEVAYQSWKTARGLSLATMPGMPRFFRELTRRAAANGWLRLWILRLDGRAIATEYQIAAGGVVHALRADFDAAAADLSPGSSLNFRIARALFERGDVREYDMGPGTNDYKLRWATGARETAGLEIYAPTAYGRGLHAIETRVVPAARRLRDRVLGRCA